MRDFPGAPGTHVGVLLRCFQLVFSAFTMLCLVVMAAPYNRIVYFLGLRFFTPSRPFSYLVWPVTFEVGLIFLTCIVAYALANRTAVVSYAGLVLLATLDWVAATLSLAVASSLAGTSGYITGEMICTVGVECRVLQQLFAPAYIMSWLANVLSHLITLWVLAGGI